jgi:putative DNA methylase
VIRSPKKLIEVALPLDAINVACVREKSIRHGHPSTLHLWWARRPLAAARAVIFAQMVNDPSWKWELENPGAIAPGNLKASWAASRKRLFKIIEDLVLWENTTNEAVLEKARAEIRRSWREVCELNADHPQAAELFNPEKLPGLHDPFAGGGAIPLEAQRLGLAAYASDLNPVAVLINKAMIEIPPMFAGRAPVGPLQPGEGRQTSMASKDWSGAKGLAEDVRRYGQWMRTEAEKRIGHLYPTIEVTDDMSSERKELIPLVGKKLTVIAWLWARTVKSPNPAFSHVAVPLASTFVLSSKVGKETYVEPVITGDSYRFTVQVGTLPKSAMNGTKLARGANFKCLMSDTPIASNHIYGEANAGHMSARLMAIVAEGERGRVYLAPTPEMEAIALTAKPEWKPELAMPENPRWFSPPLYGLKTYGDLFTPRQLVALTTFSDLVAEAREKVKVDALAAIGGPDSPFQDTSLDQGGTGPTAYADAVAVYLGFSIDKATDYWSSICTWHSSRELIRNTFGRQAIPMTWDFAETNPFSDSAGNVSSGIEWAKKCLEWFPAQAPGLASQADAQRQDISINKVVSTDPPYYDNIGYADLSDFFYVWMRRALKQVYPSLFATLAVPKAEELVATPYRHGNKKKAEAFFLDGMTRAMHNLVEQAHPAFPVTIYYAFKAAETKGEGTASTGWETFLEAVLQAGFTLTGTWPMRTELSNRMVGSGTNALASSIVLVCRQRASDAPTISRRQFQRELNAILPEALDEMTRGAEGDHSPVAPVDLSQAIIGPGMAVFSRYAAVLEADGSAMGVKTALQLINRFLSEDDFDAESQFCLHWFEQHGWSEGVFGEADVLARSKSTSVSGLDESGVLFSGGGKVRLRKWADYPSDWDPTTDNRLPIWEALHQLIRALKQGGEAASGVLLAPLAGKTEAIRQLAYRLYTLCERQGWAEDARAYNELITSWTGIEAAAVPEASQPIQGNLFT